MQTAIETTKDNENKRVFRYPFTRATLAKIYRVSEETIRAWLFELGIVHSKQLKPSEVRRLFESAELPSDVVIVGIAA